jgi:hypothetical protein
MEVMEPVLGKQVAGCWLVCLLFYLEDGGDIFL